MTMLDSIIGLWPSAADLARDIGIKPNHLQTMKARGSIPSAYWAKMTRAARRRGIEGVSLERLAQIASATKFGRRRRDAASAA